MLQRKSLGMLMATTIAALAGTFPGGGIPITPRREDRESEKPTKREPNEYDLARIDAAVAKRERKAAKRLKDAGLSQP